MAKEKSYLEGFNDRFKESLKIFKNTGPKLLKNLKEYGDGVTNIYKGLTTGDLVKFRKGQLQFYGSQGRGISNILGGTIGAAANLVLPDSWKAGIGTFGQVLDIGKDLEAIRKSVDEGKIIAPWDKSNQGLLNENWSFLGDKEDRGNIQDTANGVISIWGTKGIGSGVKGTISGIKSVGRVGKTALKGDLLRAAEIASQSKDIGYIPFASQLRKGIMVTDDLSNAILGNGSRLKNLGKAGLHVWETTMEDLPAFHWGVPTMKMASNNWDPEYTSDNAQIDLKNLFLGSSTVAEDRTNNLQDYVQLKLQTPRVIVLEIPVTVNPQLEIAIIPNPQLNKFSTNIYYVNPETGEIL